MLSNYFVNPIPENVGYIFSSLYFMTILPSWYTKFCYIETKLTIFNQKKENKLLPMQIVRHRLYVGADTGMKF